MMHLRRLGSEREEHCLHCKAEIWRDIFWSPMKWEWILLNLVTRRTFCVFFMGVINTASSETDLHFYSFKSMSVLKWGDRTLAISTRKKKNEHKSRSRSRPWICSIFPSPDSFWVEVVGFALSSQLPCPSQIQNFIPLQASFTCPAFHNKIIL